MKFVYVLELSSVKKCCKQVSHELSGDNSGNVYSKERHTGYFSKKIW